MFLLSHDISHPCPPGATQSKKLKLRCTTHGICVSSGGNRFPRRSSVPWLVLPSRAGGRLAGNQGLPTARRRAAPGAGAANLQLAVQSVLPGRLAGSARCTCSPFSGPPSSLKTQIPTEAARRSYFPFQETAFLVICGALGSRRRFPVV